MTKRKYSALSSFAGGNSIPSRQISFSKSSYNLPHLRTLVDSTDQAFILFDTGFTILAFNKAAKRLGNLLMGFELTEGKSFFDVTSTDMLDYLNNTLVQVLQGNETKMTREFCVDNKHAWFEFKYKPVFDDSGKVTAITFSAEDCTEKKSGEQKITEQYAQLQIKNVELNKINAELDRFVYSASHELRAPLTSLLGLINLAVMETEDHHLITDMMFMEQVITKLDYTIQDIIHYSQNSRVAIENEPIDFNLIINDILDSMRYKDEFHLIIKDVQIENKKLFLSDKVRIRMILNNLISNAIKFYDPTKSRSNISIKIKTGLRKAEITVEDNGIGIPDDHLDSIFKMFYKGPNKQSGSGLGLYIVKESIEKLKGTLRVKSKHGKGTSFSIIIPGAKYREL
jgi:PAS domain S-box-containing protein